MSTSEVVETKRNGIFGTFRIFQTFGIKPDIATAAEHKTLSVTDQVELLHVKEYNLKTLKAEIEKQTELISSNLICNLSNQNLSPAAISLLRKGYSFAPTSTVFSQKIKFDMQSRVDIFLNKLRAKLNSSNWHRAPPAYPAVPKISVPTSKAISLFGALSRLSTTSRQTTIAGLTTNNLFNSLALRNLRNRLLTVCKNSSAKFSDNLGPAERKEMRNLIHLSRNRDVIIRKADKSQQIVLMNKADYDGAMIRMLSDTTNYEKIAFNKKFLTAAKIKQIIKNYLGRLLTTEQARNLLQFTANPQSRLIYGLPKTHKPREKWNIIPPLRPICPDIRTETAQSGKLIAYYLSPIMQHLPSYIKNSYELVKILSGLPPLPPAAVLLVADIDNLYPSLPIRESLNRVVNKLHEVEGGTPLETEFIAKLLEIQLENNCFTFGNTHYRQLKGIPMGKAWAPAVASIYLEKWESEIFAKTKIKPILYVRYIDDILCILQSHEEADLLIEHFNSTDSNIRLSEQCVARTVHFLDLYITILGSKVTTALYSKPSHLRILLDFNSAHSTSLKTNIVLSQLIRIYRLHTDLSVAGNSMYVFIQLMINLRGLQQRTARRIWTRFISWVGRQGTPAKKRPESFVALTVANNVFQQPFRRAIISFSHSLSHQDQQCVEGVGIREISGRSIGSLLFTA